MRQARQQLVGIGRWFKREWQENPLGSGLMTWLLIFLTVIVIRTAQLDNLGFESKSLWDWLELLLVPLALGLGGSVFAFRLTRSVEARQERNTLTVEIYNQFMARYRDFSRLRHLLQDSQESELQAAERNDLRDFGNWLDLVATLANQELLNTQLVAEWQLDEMVCLFYRQTERLAFLAEARQTGWRNMQRYCERRTGDGK